MNYVLLDGNSRPIILINIEYEYVEAQGSVSMYLLAFFCDLHIENNA